MAVTPPTFISSTDSTYTATGSSKSINITTSANDLVVAYGAIANNGGGSNSLSTPTSGNATFSLQTVVGLTSTYSPTYLWSGVDNTGGTGWTISTNYSGSGTVQWGFSGIVFRNHGGVGANAAAGEFGPNTSPYLTLTTTGDNSAIVILIADRDATDGSTRTWQTVNSITPTSGNGYELLYANSAQYTVYGAYYPDAGAAGDKVVGLSNLDGHNYTVVALEILGTVPTVPVVSTFAATNITPTTATANGAVESDGASTITERGVCWSTSALPTTADSSATSAGTTGPYSVNMTGLSNNTTYHMRAYATNSLGTSYGPNITMISNGGPLVWIKQ